MSILSDARATGGKVWDPNAKYEEPVKHIPFYKKIHPGHIIVSFLMIVVLSFFYMTCSMISSLSPKDLKETTKGNTLTYRMPAPSLIPGWFESSQATTKLEKDWIISKTNDDVNELVSNKELDTRGRWLLSGEGLNAWYDGKDSYYQVEKNVEGQKVTLTLTKIKDLAALNKAMTS
jgi:hypothetical protein